MKKVSCVIAAYNEGERIGGVLSAVADHPLVDEVIVVDDGSHDDTREVVRQWKNVTLISHEKNRGKSSAVVTGIKRSSHDHILMLDADLIGLSKEDITQLIEPVHNGEADISISLRKNSLPIMRWIGLDYVSGERVFRKEVLVEHLDTIEQLRSFAIESFFNRIIIQKAFRIKVVRWENTITPRKSAKVGFLKGAWGDIKMIGEIIQHVGVGGIVRQNYKMHKLKVKPKTS